MASNRPKLTDDIRAFIVAQLAAYESPGDVAALVRQEYGIEVSRQTCESYDPNKFAGRNLAKKWVALYQKARRDYMERTDDIPTANKAVRLRLLDEAARKAKRSGNHVLMASLLEQIAKEAGDAFSSKRTVAVTNAEGGALAVEHTGEVTVAVKGSVADLVKATLEELAEDADGSGAS